MLLWPDVYDSYNLHKWTTFIKLKAQIKSPEDKLGYKQTTPQSNEVKSSPVKIPDLSVCI